MIYTFKEKIKAYVEITRPWWIPVLLPVLLGPAFIANNGYPPALKTLFAVISFSLLKCSATVFNDYSDRNLDKMIHEKRPIPSGRISQTEALVFGTVLMAVGLISAIFVNPTFFFLGIFSFLFYLLHIWKIKRSVSVPGIATMGTNFSVSLIVLGGWTIVSPINLLSIYLTFLVFLWDLSHDTTSAIRDYYGDKSERLPSFAVAFGNKNAAKIAGLLFLIVLCMSIHFGTIFEIDYFSHVILIIGLITAFYLFHLVRDPNINNAVAAHKILSLYIIGFFAIIIIFFSLMKQ